MALATTDAIRLSAEIVQSGLSSETIKLRGSINEITVEGAKKSAEIDAAYIDVLLSAVRKTLSQA